MQMNGPTLTVGIVGASGFTGAELLRLLAQHPDFELRVATGDSMAGRRAAELYPSLELGYPNLVFSEFDIDAVSGLDLVFLGLPARRVDGAGAALVGSVGCVVDLSAAFRLADASAYPEYYGFEHTQPELLAEAVFGLPELHRTELKGARLVATPGCHVTAATLALRPLVDAGLIETTGVVVNTLTGITGAGRAPTDTNVFTNIDSNVIPYGLLAHRHTPEMEQEIGAQLLFTPHLVPMSRGLLATCTAPASSRVHRRRRRRRDEVLLRRGALRRRARSAAGDEVGPRIECRARVGPLRRTNEHRDLDVRHRQSHQGRVRRCRPGGQCRLGSGGDRRPPDDRTRRTMTGLAP